MSGIEGFHCENLGWKIASIRGARHWYIFHYNTCVYTMPLQKRAHYGISAHPLLWVKFPQICTYE